MAERLRIVATLRERLSWPKERQEAFRLTELKAFLAHARKHSPWHRARLQSVDIDALTMDRLADIPPMTKADLMENWDAIVTRPGMTLAAAEDHLAMVAADGKARYFDGDCHVILSSGTSGQRGVYAYDWKGWATYSAGNLRSVRLEKAMKAFAATLGRPPRAAIIAVTKPTHAISALHSCFSRPKASEIISFDLPREALVDRLNDCQPDTLVCYAALVGTLLEEAKSGRLTVPLKVISATGEKIDPAVAAEARKFWDLRLPVLNPWASVETIGAFACERGAGGHLGEDINIFELVDQDDAPVPPGAISDKILVTVLYNRLLPLIRYEIPDKFREIPEPCSCGCPEYRRVDVHGRSEGFRYGDIVVHAAVFDLPLVDDRRINRFQVRQTRRGADVDIVAEGFSPDDLRALGDLISRHLAALGVADPLVNMRAVEALTPGPSGKTPSLVPLPVSG